MKILAAVVTYNRKEILLEVLEALANIEEPVEILVFDNASTDGTMDALMPWIRSGRIHYHRSAHNIGGAGGFYKLCQEAMRREVDYVWLMDDDCIVRPDSLSRLLEEAKRHPEAGFFSSKALWTDGTENQMNQHRLLEKPDHDKAVRCQEATFVSMLVSVPALKKYGLPIPDLFIWGDDIEFSRRFSRFCECWYVPKSVVLHKTTSNNGSDISTDTPERLSRYRYAYRNEVYVAKQEGAGRCLRQVCKLIYHTFKVLRHSNGFRKEKIRLMWSASKEGLNFDPPVYYR